jgi:hypothetical protein
MEIENKPPVFYFTGNALLRCKKWLFAPVQIVFETGHYL